MMRLCRQVNGAPPLRRTVGSVNVSIASQLPVDRYATGI